MTRFSNTLAVMIAAMSLCVPISSKAQTISGGYINKISTAASSGNVDLRVTFAGVGTVCNGANDPGFAYINSNDPNYGAMASSIFMAAALSKNTSVTVSLVAGYCKISFIQVYP